MQATFKQPFFLNLTKLPAGILLASGMTVFTAQTQAAGFALIEQSASGQGLSYAGAAASVEDASVMWFNPAGLTQIEKDQLIVAGHIISPNTEYTDAGSGNSVKPGTVGFVPNFYWKTQFADLDFGFGVNVPYGQKLDYGNAWEGAAVATLTDLKTINLNPAVAIKLSDQLSVGFGLNAQFVDVALDTNQVEITGDSWAFGYNAGLMYQPSGKMTIGLAYRSEVKHSVEGEFTQGGVYTNTATSDVTMPASATLAMDYAFTDQTNLLASATWTQWSAYDQLVINLNDLIVSTSPFMTMDVPVKSAQNFEDSMRYALGMTHQYTPSFKVRAGVAIDYTPVPNAESRSPRTPDSTKKWLSLGLGYKLNSAMNLDVGYSRLMSGDYEINYQGITGTYESSVDILSAQLVWDY